MEEKEEKKKKCKHCKEEIDAKAKVCPHCRKKQSNPILTVIIVLVVIGVLGSCMGKGSDTKSTAASAAPTETAGATEKQEETETAKTETPEAPKEPTVTKYKSSTYKIGDNMPAGEYVLFCDGLSGYFELDSDSSGKFESILSNDNFAYNSIITVSDGQYLQITGSYAVPIAEAVVSTDNDGMFKIGTNLDAGEYKLEVVESALGSGYYEVSTNSNHDLNSIVSNNNFEGETYITVQDGQYLKLSGCKISK